MRMSFNIIVLKPNGMLARAHQLYMDIKGRCGRITNRNEVTAYFVCPLGKEFRPRQAPNVEPFVLDPMTSVKLEFNFNFNENNGR